MKKRILAYLAAAVFALSLTAGENGTDSSETDTKVKVTLNEVAHSIFYAPMYVAIEEGYFDEEGIDLDLVCGFGADKTMTAVISGEADIGFMGSEASIYTYAEGATDYVVNFAQLTQRAGNFLVAREEMPDFTWDDLKGHLVLGGRKGGMPQMVFRLRTWRSTRISTSDPLPPHLPKAREIIRLSSNPAPPHWNPRGKAMSSLPLARTAAMCPTRRSARSRVI